MFDYMLLLLQISAGDKMKTTDIIRHSKEKSIFCDKISMWNRNRAIPIFSIEKECIFADIFYSIVSKYCYDFLSEREKKELVYEKLNIYYDDFIISDTKTLNDISKEICDLYQKSLQEYKFLHRVKKNNEHEIKHLKQKNIELEELVISLQNKIIIITSHNIDN